MSTTIQFGNIDYQNGPFTYLRLRDGKVRTGLFILLKFADGSPHAYVDHFSNPGELTHYIDVVYSVAAAGGVV